jgi:hypothetical protein
VATKRRIEITVETEQITVARDETSLSAWCDGCQSHVLLIGAQQAAQLAELSLRQLVSKTFSAELHFYEPPDGRLLICLASLSQWLRRSSAPALLLSATAQNGQSAAQPQTEVQPAAQGSLLGTQVKLPCEGVSGGDVASTVRVTNNTGNTIPSQTVIYLQTSNGPDQEALSSPLANRRSANLNAPKGNTPKSCQAWFFKQ